jgi:DnaJ-class molecular chaperone
MIHGENSYGDEFARTPDEDWIECSECNGRGFISFEGAADESCEKCAGEGRVKENEDG